MVSIVGDVTWSHNVLKIVITNAHFERIGTAAGCDLCVEAGRIKIPKTSADFLDSICCTKSGWGRWSFLSINKALRTFHLKFLNIHRTITMYVRRVSGFVNFLRFHDLL